MALTDTARRALVALSDHQLFGLSSVDLGRAAVQPDADNTPFRSKQGLGLFGAGIGSRLEAQGLVEHFYSGSKCWRITEFGRKVLEADQDPSADCEDKDEFHPRKANR